MKRPGKAARELANTPEFAHAQRQRKKVEALFAELKHQIGLRRLRLRRLKFVREQFFLAAVAQNIKRTRAVPQPSTTNIARSVSHHLAEATEKTRQNHTRSQKRPSADALFQHPHLISSVITQPLSA